MALMPNPYGDAVGRMDRRFLTTSVVPTVVFLTAYAVVLIGSAWSYTAAAAWWTDRSIAEQVVAGIVAWAIVWFLAGLVASNWRKIVRLYEGYPLTRLARRIRGRLAKRDSAEQTANEQTANEQTANEQTPDFDRPLWGVPGVAWHWRRANRLVFHSHREQDAYMRYPAQRFWHDLLPTTIGNVLLASERYGDDRYGFDITVLWPRFWWCLPADVKASLEEFEEQHELPLALSFGAFVFSVLSTVTTIAGGASWFLFLISGGGGFVLAITAYLLAIERAEEYAEQIRTAVDLHHDRLGEIWRDLGTDPSQPDFLSKASEWVLGGPAAMAAGVASPPPPQRDVRVVMRVTPPVPRTGSIASSGSTLVLQQDRAYLVPPEDGDQVEISTDTIVRMMEWAEQARAEAAARYATVVVDATPSTVPGPEAALGAPPTSPTSPTKKRLAVKADMRAFERVLARVRLLWAVCISAALFFGVASCAMVNRTTEVVVVKESEDAQTIAAGELIPPGTADVPRHEVATGAVIHDSADRIALRPLAPGDQLSDANSVSVADLVVLDIRISPWPAGTTATLVTDVLISPCGVIVEDAVVQPPTLVSGRPAAPQLFIHERSVDLLDGCNPDSARLLLKTFPR